MLGGELQRSTPVIGDAVNVALASKD